VLDRQPRAAAGADTYPIHANGPVRSLGTNATCAGGQSRRRQVVQLAVDLAEALEAIRAVEQRDAVEVVDEWFHDQPAPELPDAGAGSGLPHADR
jgi:hypothetical protein